jgi:DNA gyrase subunit A
MKEDYMAYSMAVLLGRAIPDMYDGLKPAQRRVLQTMFEEGLMPDKRYVKCARVTGLAMGYYHPHGDCYGTLVNMATTWNNNVPWVDGHGNFGSTVDGPAAARYTECKLRPSAVELLLQDKATWETRPNYDGSRQEAERFNTAIPSVLLNGDTGIAVGFATKLAPHSLRAVVEATKLACEFKAPKEAKARELLIPDFPTGCDIVNDEELKRYKETGSGNIRCRAKCESGVQKRSGKAKDRGTLTFTNFPPGVNPEKLGEQVRDALEKGKLDGIAEVIDESDLSGDRVTIVAKPNVGTEQLVEQLYAYTDLDTRYSAKTLVIDGTRPVELSPVEICQKWFSWRMARLERKFSQELDLTEQRLEIVMGFIKAIDKIDAIIKKIKESASKKEALVALVDRPFKFTRDQAEAILEMRLRQLTGLDQAELEAEKETLEERLKTLDELVKNKEVRHKWVYTQITELAKRHGEARRSALVEPPAGSLAVSPRTGEKRPPAPPKPRFLKIDLKKGMVEQAKGPRGAMVVDAKEKVVLMTQDGFLKKVGATFKGPISTGYGPVALAKREAEVSQRKYLCVFKLEGQLKALVLSGEDLCKATSKGKLWLPAEAEFVYLGEGSYSVPWVSIRKKKVELSLSTVKQGRPGAKGIKVANLEEVQL